MAAHITTMLHEIEALHTASDLKGLCDALARFGSIAGHRLRNPEMGIPERVHLHAALGQAFAKGEGLAVYWRRFDIAQKMRSVSIHHLSRAVETGYRHPDECDLKYDLSFRLALQGKLVMKAGEVRGAVTLLSRSAELIETLIGSDQHPYQQECIKRGGYVYYRLSNAQHKLGNAEAAQRYRVRAAELFTQSVEFTTEPNEQIMFREHICQLYRSLARGYQRLGDEDRAARYRLLDLGQREAIDAELGQLKNSTGGSTY